MGDKQLQLETALEKSRDRGIFCLLQTSTRIGTEPCSGVEQDTLVAEVETWMTPEDSETLLAIEQEMGRVREIKWGPVIGSRLFRYEDTILLQSKLDLCCILMWQNVPLS